jgi:TPR repeat protein
MEWMRKAAEKGLAVPCLELAARMYGDHPYAREVGHVGRAVQVDSIKTRVESAYGFSA